MVIIYNNKGLIVGGLSAVLGGYIALSTGSLALGLGSMAPVWLLFGRSKVDPNSGTKKPAASIFFIPLFYLAFPLLGLAAVVFITEQRNAERPEDPRKKMFVEDGMMLGIQEFGGNTALSMKISTELKAIMVKEAQPENINIFTKMKEDRVLLLLRMPTLKRLSDPARTDLLDALSKLLETLDETKGKKSFIGIRGQVLFGAVRNPNFTEVGGTVSETHLYGFYDISTSKDTSENRREQKVSFLGRYQISILPRHLTARSA